MVQRTRIYKDKKNNTDPIPFHNKTILRRNKKRMEKSKDFQGQGSMLETIFDLFIVYLEEGNPLDVVQDLVGITQITFAKWIKRGEDYEEKVLVNEHDPMDETCYAFMREIRKAIAESKRKHVLRLNSTNPIHDWKQSLAILERRDRNNWGRDVIAANKEVYDPDESFL